jgi:PKHD-type hydroxylase
MKYYENNSITHDWWLEVGHTELWAYQHNLFTNSEVEQIHDIAAEYQLDTAKVGSGEQESENTSIRNSNIAFLRSSDEANKWIFERITGAIVNINRQFWNFDLRRIETLQYSEYGVGQFYRPHIDMMYQAPNNAIRKLSFTIQLTDPEEYEGGDVIIKSGDNAPIHKNKGTIIFFPSYTLHEVEPVTKGTRHALVGWITGPMFK